MTALAPTLQAFFTDRLLTQRQVSPRTVAAYRDTMRLLLVYAQQHVGTPPSRLDMADLDADLVTGFLSHLERDRHNGARTRNARLAAIHSLFRFAALRHPEHSESIARVLDIPAKRHDRPLISYLTPDEVNAVLAAPDQSTWIGRRDHALLVLDVQTGLRASELTALTVADIRLNDGPHVKCVGKGRKHRATPLTSHTVTVLRSWMRERSGHPADPVFPTRQGRPLSVDAIQWRLAKHVTAAAACCPSLTGKDVSPHTLRHTCAVNLLRAGIDIATIALWLGHADIRATQAYLHVDLSMKERALTRTTPPDVRPGRFKPSDKLLAFLEQL
jgi:integrase/recombinase XerD